MSKLVIVGTVAFDAVETPFGKTDKILGGSASYIGLSASQFEVDSAIVSVVGGDFPQEYLNLFSERSIDISSIEVIKEGKTFFWSGRYHNDMNTRDTLATELNVLENFQPIVPETYKDAKVLVLGNLHPIVQSSVLDQMKDASTLVILDTMNFWMDNTLNDLLDVIKRVDVITINDEEARQLTGEYSLVTAAKKIHDMGPEYVVIKKGEHGAVLFHEDGLFALPAFPVTQLHDPTGAGDSFAGALIGRLASRQRSDFSAIKEAMLYATCTASLTVEAFGCERLESAGKSVIDERVQSLKQLISVA